MLAEAIEQIRKLRIDTEKNQHHYYSAVLKEVETKLLSVYKGNHEAEVGGMVEEFLDVKISSNAGTPQIFPTPNFDGVSENVIEEMVNNGTPSHEALELFDEATRPEIGIAVDCGTLDGNNPGLFEYRIVDIASGKTLKRVKIPGKTTNNIAEFLALVDGIVWCCELKIQGAVYSDSKNALAWVKKGACRTKFNVTNRDQKDMIAEAEDQLILTSYHNAGVKTSFWSNKRFGETPADLSGKKGVKK